MLIAAGLVGHANRYHNQSGHHSGNSESSTALGAVMPEPIPQPETAEARKEAREEADLAAQTRMAVAAENAFNISIVSAFLLAAAVAFAGLAWLAAKASADADNEALELTRTQLKEAREDAAALAELQNTQIETAVDAAKAAWANEKTAREIGQKRASAYVHAVSMTFRPPKLSQSATLLEQVESLTINFENIGQTVAKNVIVLYKIKVGAATGMWSYQEPDDTTPSRISNIAPNQKTGAISTITIPENTFVDSYPEEEQMVFVTGSVRYSDVFGQRYRTTFKFWIFRKAHRWEEPLTVNVMAVKGPAFEAVEQQKWE